MSADPRRPLDLPDLAAIRRELDRLETADRAGTLEARGDWTFGQVCWHVARFMRMSREGFPFRPPLPVRLVGRLMKGWALGPKPMPTGIKLRGGMRQLAPPANAAEGPAQLRAELDAVLDGGARFTEPSPLLGPLSHHEWARLHAKHAAHHFGFLDPHDGDAAR